MRLKSTIALLAAAVLSTSCGGAIIRPPAPVQPPIVTPPAPAAALQFDLVQCAGAAPVAPDNYCAGAPGALFTITPVGVADAPRIQQGDGNGYTFVTAIPVTWKTVTLSITAPGYVPYVSAGPLSTADLIANNAVKGLHNFFTGTPAHVDPSNIPLKQLAAFRGAMWPQGPASSCGGLPFGPRPGQPDNIIATDFMANYSPEQQLCIVTELRARGYTHVVMGPIVDSDGYHGTYAAHDWRGAAFETFLDTMQFFWDHGLAPVVFIHPDGWTLAQTQELTPLFTSARAQRLMRIVIPSGWEPTRYDWSSCTWAGYVSWARATWPNALVGIHTTADVDAPVGTDALCDDNGKPNGLGWQRVADAGLHVWLVQNGAYTTAPSADPTLAYNFGAQFSTGPDGAATHGAAWHFAGGIQSWPTNSGWGPGVNILMINAEVTSYTAFWSHMPEAARTPWGDLAVQAGGGGYLDGGTAPVPVRR